MVAQIHTARRTTQSVDVKKFVEVCCKATMEGHDTQWIADQLGVNADYVNSKRVSLRKLGVALPALARGRGGLEQEDVDAFNKMITDLVNPPAPQAPARGRGARGGRHAGATAG